MARARNIKPAFFDNDKLALENDPLGRLLFIGLWTLADCNGNLEWRSARIKARLLPYDECDIDRLGKNLDQSGFVRFYSDGDKLYLHIPKFTEHQNPHKNERERGGEAPEYTEQRRQLVDLSELTINPDFSGAEPSQDETDHAESPILNPDPGILKEESGDADASGSGEPAPAKSEGTNSEPPKGKSTQPKRATQMPADFRPSESHERLAAEMGVSLSAEFEQFCDYHVAKGSTYKDWGRALNTWLRNARKFGGANRGGGQQRNAQGETPQQRAERMWREKQERESTQ